MTIDITALEASFVTQLRVSPSRVMQSFDRDPTTGLWYAAQAYNSDADTRVWRLSASGDVLDYADLKGAGHGSVINVQNVSGWVYIWNWWATDTVGSNDATMTRWKYSGTASGNDVTRDDADIETLPNFAGSPILTCLDVANDRIAVRVASGSNGTFELRKLSEYINDIDNVLYTVGPFDADVYGTIQGMAIDGDYLYVARGGDLDMSDPDRIPPQLQRIEWSTGDHTEIDTTQYGLTDAGVVDGDHNEAEGVIIWRDPAGTSSVLFGMATGLAGKRLARVYGFSSNSAVVAQSVRYLTVKDSAAPNTTDPGYTMADGWALIDTTWTTRGGMLWAHIRLEWTGAGTLDAGAAGNITNTDILTMPAALRPIAHAGSDYAPWGWIEATDAGDVRWDIGIGDGGLVKLLAAGIPNASITSSSRVYLILMYPLLTP